MDSQREDVEPPAGPESIIIRFRSVNRSSPPAKAPREGSLDPNPENVERPARRKSPAIPPSVTAPENDNEGAGNVSGTGELSNAPSTVTSASRPGYDSDASSEEDYHEENGIETGNAAPASAPQVAGEENPLGFDDGLFVDPGTGTGPFNMATPYGSAFLPSVPLAFVDEFRSAEGRVTDAGFCVRCLKLLSRDPDYVCSRVNSQRKCEYCARLGKECKTTPRRYRRRARDVATSERDEGFPERVAEFTCELDSHFRIHVPSNEGTRALWSINRNLFR